MTESVYMLIQIGVIALVTAALRFLPFWVFPEGRKRPRIITYLGTVLPYAIMAMLVVYCLRGTPILGPTHGLPELIAVLIVTALHLWKHNTLLSVFGGTVCYMVLVQVIFA